jgi:hypothetical protein
MAFDRRLRPFLPPAGTPNTTAAFALKEPAFF